MRRRTLEEMLVGAKRLLLNHDDPEIKPPGVVMATLFDAAVTFTLIEPDRIEIRFNDMLIEENINMFPSEATIAKLYVAEQFGAQTDD